AFIFLFMSISQPTLYLRVTQNENDVEQLSEPFTIEPTTSGTFVVGACGPRSITNWDPCTYVVSTGDYI
ncbi:MAG: hypothetical protein ACFFG0_25410, partial [Candidatus Thorarchaeota archaeon]